MEKRQDGEEGAGEEREREEMEGGKGRMRGRLGGIMYRIPFRLDFVGGTGVWQWSCSQSPLLKKKNKDESI